MVPMVLNMVGWDVTTKGSPLVLRGFDQYYESELKSALSRYIGDNGDHWYNSAWWYDESCSYPGPRLSKEAIEVIRARPHFVFRS